jgi:carboxylesterase
MTASSGTPLIALLHGLHSSREELVFIESSLKRKGLLYQSVAIKGYTISDEQNSDRSTLSWQSWLTGLTHELELLHSKHGPVVLSGISTGANLTIAAALSAPHLLAGIAPMSTSIFLDGWSIPFYSFLLPLAYYTPLGALWSYKESPPYGVKDERIRKWIASDLIDRGQSAAGSSSIPNDFLRENHRLRLWLRSALKQKKGGVPILALHAQEDEIASVRNVRYLKNHWQKELFSEFILNDSYHMICVDRERAKVTDALAEFSKKLSVIQN